MPGSDLLSKKRRQPVLMTIDRLVERPRDRCKFRKPNFGDDGDDVMAVEQGMTVVGCHRDLPDATNVYG
jgi:hypothetical protein